MLHPTKELKTPSPPGGESRGANLKQEAETPETTASACNTADVNTKLAADKGVIEELKTSVATEKSRSATIQAKVRELKTQLKESESALKKAREEFGGKSDEHNGAKEALATAEANVKMCTRSISSVDENVGQLTAGLESLKNEIEALGTAQAQTIALFDEATETK